MKRMERCGLKIAAVFAQFIEDSALPGTGVNADQFWRGLSDIVHEFGPQNEALLAKREEMQHKIDQWHKDQKGTAIDPQAYHAMLRKIGYIVPSEKDFEIDTSGIDPEIATIAGPQLVVPITNARFAINAANARWNSLYDALYGTDAIDGSLPRAGGYDPERGGRVIEWAKSFLDKHFELANGTRHHADVTKYLVSNQVLEAEFEDGERSTLSDPRKFVGTRGSSDQLQAILLGNNNLHVEIIIDRSHSVGGKDRAGVADIVMESAVTTIMDCEDSVAVVDADDKVKAYQNWLGLMKGDLEAEVTKGDHRFVRRLNPDREYSTPQGEAMVLKGRSLQLVRNVGMLMRSPAILDRGGKEIFEGLLDAMCTVMIALHDVRGKRQNSKSGSVYVVKPKLHGPEETAFTNRVFSRVEQWLDLPENTIKIGIMDEERRTTVNLTECIRAARKRVAFINTGFLDRTGDEIHTSMEAGPFMRKADLKAADWLDAYEDWNTEAGIACGLVGSGQIGKGMWAMPDRMQEMLEQKIGHPMAGANTAWVPSPTAAVLHATHYHEVNVKSRQDEICASARKTDLHRITTIPIATETNWSEAEIRNEVENNLQGILGYVVRWIDQGIGCSKVPDISNVQLMEDRATCRISSQHVANWLHHGIVDQEYVEAAFRRMAKVVDGQNVQDPNYRPMAPDFTGPAFNAAKMLVFEGRMQPSGYTEPVLHQSRLAAKGRTD